MSSCNCPPLANHALRSALNRQVTADILGQNPQRAVPNGGLAIFLMVAIVVGSVLPAPPTSAQVTHLEITRLNSTRMLLSTTIWNLMKDKMQLEKAYFHECLFLKKPPCLSIPTLVQKLDEIRQYRGKAARAYWTTCSLNLVNRASARLRTHSRQS